MDGTVKALKSKRYMTFDCYGTLIDWESGLIASLKPIFKKYNINITPIEILSLYSKLESKAENEQFVIYSEILIQVMGKLFLNFKVDPEPGDERCLVEGIKQFTPFPDTVDALKILDQKYKLGVITNTDKDIFEITKKGLEVDFYYILTSEDVRCYKPSTRVFNKMLNDLNCQPDDIVHVAQSMYHDIQPAQKLGIMSVHVNRSKQRHGFGATPEAEGKADLVVEDLEALSKILF